MSNTATNKAIAIKKIKEYFPGINQQGIDAILSNIEIETSFRSDNMIEKKTTWKSNWDRRPASMGGTGKKDLKSINENMVTWAKAQGYTNADGTINVAQAEKAFNELSRDEVNGIRYQADPNADWAGGYGALQITVNNGINPNSDLSGRVDSLGKVATNLGLTNLDDMKKRLGKGDSQAFALGLDISLAHYRDIDGWTVDMLNNTTGEGLRYGGDGVVGGGQAINAHESKDKEHPVRIFAKYKAGNEAYELKNDIDESKSWDNKAKNNPLTTEEITAFEEQIDNFSVQFYKDWDAGKFEDTDNDDLGTLFIEQFNEQVLGLGLPQSDQLNADYERLKNHPDYKGKSEEEVKNLLIAKNQKQVADQARRGANQTPYIYNGFEGIDEMTVEQLGKLENMQALFEERVSGEEYAEKIQKITTGSKNGSLWWTAGVVDTGFEEMFEEIHGGTSIFGKQYQEGFASLKVQGVKTAIQQINPAKNKLKNNPLVKKDQHNQPMVSDEDLDALYAEILEKHNLMDDVRAGKATTEELITEVVLDGSSDLIEDNTDEEVVSQIIQDVENETIEADKKAALEEGEEALKEREDKLLKEFGAYKDDQGNIVSEDYITKQDKELSFEQWSKKYPDGTKEDYQAMLDEIDLEEQDKGKTYFDLRGEAAFEESFLDKMGGLSSLIGLATGALGLGSALKDVDIPKDPKLGPAFQQRLEESKRMAQQGLTPSELAKAHNDLDSSYAIGIDNIVRGSAGNRAQFMAGLGGLDVARQSALMDIAVADAQMQRQNQEKYDSMMLMNEQYEAARQAKYQDAQFKQDSARQAAGAALVGNSIAMISDAIGSRQLNRYNKMKTEKLLMDMGYKSDKDGESGQDQVGTDDKGKKLQTKWGAKANESLNLLNADDQAVNTNVSNQPNTEINLRNTSALFSNSSSVPGSTTSSGLISNSNDEVSLGNQMYDIFNIGN